VQEQAFLKSIFVMFLILQRLQFLIFNFNISCCFFCGPSSLDFGRRTSVDHNIVKFYIQHLLLTHSFNDTSSIRLPLRARHVKPCYVGKEKQLQEWTSVLHYDLGNVIHSLFLICSVHSIVSLISSVTCCG